MPYITIEGGKLSDYQKEKLLEQLTESASKIMNVPKDFFHSYCKGIV